MKFEREALKMKKLFRPLSLVMVLVVLATTTTFSALSATIDKNLTGAGINVEKVAAYTNSSDGYATYSGNDLGANYSADSTTFKVWAPSASSVKVKLYKTGSDSEAGAGVIGTYDMTKDSSNGVWSLKQSGDLNGIYYTYLVTVNGKTNETRDVYSTACGVNSKRSMVVDLNSTNPDGWNDDSHVLFNSSSEATVWEMSVRDFSIDSSSGVDADKRGTFLGVAQHGTTLNGKGDIKTGIDYLIENKINCVQIMPMYDFGSVDETKGGQNWGYDPMNYNVPEGSFSTNPYDGAVRIKEMKTMIKALHDAGISVVMDVVYNHTYNTTDSCFENTVPGYYYRMNGNQFLNGSGCGNVTASDKTMYRKYMIDSVKYWVNEYHIDGFRFDLMGCHDITTMNKLRDELDTIDKRILTYGEPWTGTWPRDPNGIANSSAALMDNASKLNPRVGMFNDKVRDAIRGSNDNYGAASGYIMGASGFDAAVKAGEMANTSTMWGGNWSKAPTQTVTYSCCHDNLTLWDKIMRVCGSSDYDGTNSTYLAMNKLASVIEFTSQGVNFTIAGEEFARTKYGEDNSYNKGDSKNLIDWNRVSKYSDLVSYYKGLREIRSVYSPFTDSSMTSVNSSYFCSTPSGVVAYTIQNKTANANKEWGMVAVITNATSNTQTVKLQAGTTLPSSWVTVANGNSAGLKNLGTVNGSTVSVPARSSLILVDASTFDRGVTPTTPTTSTTTVPPTTTSAKKTITYNTSKIKNFNDGVSTETVANGQNVTKTIEPEDGYEIVYAKVVCGGNDITSTAYNSATSTLSFNATADTDVTIIATKIPDTHLYGDTNSDSSVTVKDASRLQKYVANITDLSATELKSSDVNNDNHVDVKDVTMIQKYVAGTVSSFPSGKSFSDEKPTYTIPTNTITTTSATTVTVPTTATTPSSTVSTGDKVLTLDPSAVSAGDERWAAYFFNSSNTSNYVWVDLDNSNSVKVPDGMDTVIFVRMNGKTTENTWDNRWNQSDDLTIGSSTKYVATGWGSGNLFTGNWA